MTQVALSSFLPEWRSHVRTLSFILLHNRICKSLTLLGGQDKVEGIVGPQVKAGLTPLCSAAQEVEMCRRRSYWLFPRTKYVAHAHHRYVIFFKE